MEEDTAHVKMTKTLVDEKEKDECIINKDNLLQSRAVVKTIRPKD